MTDAGAGRVTRRRWWPRAPISVQLVTLLLASLLVAQAISFGVILLIPPPRTSSSRRNTARTRARSSRGLHGLGR